MALPSVVQAVLVAAEPLAQVHVFSGTREGQKNKLNVIVGSLASINSE